MRKTLSTALAGAVAISAIATATAFAHTELKSTSPGKRKTVSKSLSSVTATFEGTIRSGTIKVTGPGGSTVSSGSGGRDPRNVKRLRVPLKAGLTTGTYKASWTMKAADGHTQRGSWTFKLK